MNSEQMYRTIRKIVYQILSDENILSGHWHLGRVDTVINRYSLKAFIDGATTSQVIPCNPNVIFSPGDEIWIHYVNGDIKNKFAPYKRATGTESL